MKKIDKAVKMAPFYVVVAASNRYYQERTETNETVLGEALEACPNGRFGAFEKWESGFLSGLTLQGRDVVRRAGARIYVLSAQEAESHFQEKRGRQRQGAQICAEYAPQVAEIWSVQTDDVLHLVATSGSLELGDGVYYESGQEGGYMKFPNPNGEGHIRIGAGRALEREINRRGLRRIWADEEELAQVNDQT